MALSASTGQLEAGRQSYQDASAKAALIPRSLMSCPAAVQQLAETQGITARHRLQTLHHPWQWGQIGFAGMPVPQPSKGRLSVVWPHVKESRM